MKKLYFLLIGILLLSANISTAQIAETNDLQANETAKDEVALPFTVVRYYYYPNLDAYFDNQENVYIYEQKGQWVKAPEIASGYRCYSLYNNMRYEINDYAGDKPYENLSEHRKQFPKKFSSRRQPPKVNNDTKVAFN